MKTELTAATLAKYFDQTLLKPYVSDADFKAFCEESARYHFKMIAINSAPVAKCKAYLKDSDVLVGAAIGFPLGQTTIADKVFETKQAIADGADEIDYVHNIVELKSGNLAYVEREMREIVEVCRAAGKTSKVIFENCYLTDDEKKILCEIALKVKPDFIKTSTGFGTPAHGHAGGRREADEGHGGRRREGQGGRRRAHPGRCAGDDRSGGWADRHQRRRPDCGRIQDAL